VLFLHQNKFSRIYCAITSYSKWTERGTSTGLVGNAGACRDENFFCIRILKKLSPSYNFVACVFK